MPTAAAASSATIAALHSTARTNFTKPRNPSAQIDYMWPTDDVIRKREELAEQLRALKDLASMAKLPELKARA